MRNGCRKPLPSTKNTRSDSCRRCVRYCCAVFFHHVPGESLTMSAPASTRVRFLPLLLDPTAADRDDDVTTPPVTKRKLSVVPPSKLRERSVYAARSVHRWKLQRRPRALPCDDHPSVSPCDWTSLPSLPFEASPHVDLVAVQKTCADHSAMNIVPTQLFPRNQLASPSNATSSVSPTRSETVSLHAARLPPLEFRVLQRPRVFLSTNGFGSASAANSSCSAPSIGLEEIIQIQEQVPAKSPLRSQLESALRLTILPKKCVYDDEVALMPCHSLGHRGLPELTAELWREPLRDRDKNWQRDELAFILSSADKFAARRRRGLGMTMAPSPANRGKWRRWEEQKLHLKSPGGVGVSALQSPIRKRRAQLDGVLLRNFGTMISDTYCLVSIYGVGVVGRLYDSGVSLREQLCAEDINGIVTEAGGCDSAAEKAQDTTSGALHHQRHLRVEAYDPTTSRVFTLRVMLGDLAWAFHKRPEFLVAGRKLALLHELVALLYFDYPDGVRAVDTLAMDQSHSVMPQLSGEMCESNRDQESILRERDVKSPVLRLAQERRLSEAARRRMEREARLRWEEQQRLLALEAFLKLPRRARHRLVCRPVRLSGRTFIVSVYHLPTRVRSFTVIAYHPRSSTSFHLAVNVMDVAALAKVLSMPHTWSTDQRRSLAESVVPRLRFRGSRIASTFITEASSRDHNSGYIDYRAALAIQEDRQGPWAAPGWLPPLERLQTDEMIRAELAERCHRDARKSLEDSVSKERERIRQDADHRVSVLEKLLSELEARRDALTERDAYLVKQIEEIDSRGSGGSAHDSAQSSDSSGASPSKTHHEHRRAHKAARKALKADLKAVNAQIADRKRELQLVREQAQHDLDKLQRRMKRKALALSEQVAVSSASRARPLTGIESSDDAEHRASFRFSQSRHRSVRGQRTWLPLGLIRGGETTLVASGACQVEGVRFRYSLFALGGAISSDIVMFHLELYENVANRCVSLEIARLDWLALTKAACHEQQLCVPEFAIATSSVVQRVQELDAQLAGLQQELAALTLGSSTHGQGSKPRKSSTAETKVSAKRRDLASSFGTINRERRGYSRLAPWNVVVRGLCERLRLVRNPSNSVIERVELDRCLFRATLPIISLTNDDEEEDEASGDALYTKPASTAPVMTAMARRASASASADDGQVVYCNVRAMLNDEELHFEVFEPLGRQTWRLRYPDSFELLKEFAGNTFMEQQLHLEAIAMTLVFFVNSRSGRAELRFEE